jgi:hypothetical protein
MAVRAWVAQVDPGAVRTTRDVDLLVRRADFQVLSQALTRAGFVHRRSASLDLVLEAPQASPREAVRIVLAGEFVRPDHPTPSPQPEELAEITAFPLVSLEALVRMKLNAFRDKDRVHLRDMIEVGLIDGAWPERLPTELARRLRALLDEPE